MHTTYKVTVTEIATALALTPRRVQQLVKEQILPAPINGKYDLTACIQSYKKYLQHQGNGKNRGQTNSNNHVSKNNYSNLSTEKLRLLSAQANKAELEVAVLEGKYIAATEVELLWSSLLIAFRARMLSMPTNLARQLLAINGDMVAITNLLSEEIHSALLELSNCNYKDQITDAEFSIKSELSADSADSAHQKRTATAKSSKDSSPAAEANG